MIFMLLTLDIRVLLSVSIFDTFEVPLNKHVLLLCSHFVLQAIKLKNCNTIRRLTNLRYLVLRDLFCAYPRSLPLTLLERVICVFGLVLDLVLVFCGFWLVPDLLAASLFHPIAKDRVLH